MRPSSRNTGKKGVDPCAGSGPLNPGDRPSLAVAESPDGRVHQGRVRRPTTGRRKTSSPSVSIGLPVYNGEHYLCEAVQSILDQTYEDFELIISDNGSSDETASICRRFEKDDGRIRYLRNPVNLGAARNFNRVFHLSRGKYFKWAAHDDLISPRFLEDCKAVLEDDPSVSVCHSGVHIIDGKGDMIRSVHTNLPGAISPRPSRRFGAIISFEKWCFEVFGLIRSDILGQTGLIGPYAASDRVLRAELGLRGKFYELEDYLFSCRDHPKRSIRAYPAHHLRTGWFDTSLASKTVFPHWRLLREYAESLSRVSLPPGERLRCFVHLVAWLGRFMNWGRLVMDVVVAVRPSAWKSFASAAVKRDWWTGRENPC